MNRLHALSLIATTAFLLAGAPFQGAPGESDPAAMKEAEIAKAGPKPTERTWSVKSGDNIFTLVMKPGIPDPNQVTEIMIEANSIPKKAHPRYGNRVPMENASLVVEVTSPAGELVGRFAAHPIPLANGKYGIHFTPGQEGIYSLGVRATTADNQAVNADLKLPVKVWPLPAELQGNGAVGKEERKPVKGQQQ